MISRSVLARALSRELHIDPAHGFPEGFTAEDLAQNLLVQMADAGVVPSRRVNAHDGQQRGTLSVEEAAHYLGISRSHAWELISRGELPSFHIGRRRRLSVETLRNWIRSQEAAENRS